MKYHKVGNSWTSLEPNLDWIHLTRPRTPMPWSARSRMASTISGFTPGSSMICSMLSSRYYKHLLFHENVDLGIRARRSHGVAQDGQTNETPPHCSSDCPCLLDCFLN